MSENPAASKERNSEGGGQADSEFAISFESASQEESAPVGTQFGISDLFALITMCSLLLAMFIPIFPYFKDNLGTALAFVVLQCAVICGAAFFHASIRKKATENAGAKIGIGYCGEIRWKYWPQLQSWLSMCLLAGIQIMFALVASKFPLQAVGIGYQFQLSYVMSRSLLGFWNREYPGTMAFYENGIVRHGYFFGWDSLEVRPATIYPDRLVVVIKFQKNLGFGDLKVVQVPKKLREKVFAMAEKAKAS